MASSVLKTGVGGMLEFFPRLNILHCGGVEEQKFLQYLGEVITASEDVPFTLEYTEFQEQQDRKEIVYHDAEKYRNNGMPLVILISKYFFDLMWKCSRKKDLLDIISSETIKHCLHIWLDVNESDVRSYCNKLLRNDDNFKRIKYNELIDSSSDETSGVVPMIRRLLHESSRGGSGVHDNFSVDDEAEDMKSRFLEANKDFVLEEPAAVDAPAAEGATAAAGGPSKKKKKKKGNLYTDALRIASMNDEELDAYRNSGRDDNNDRDGRRGGGGGGGGGPQVGSRR